MSDNKLTELGAIWQKTSNNGGTFYSGKVTVNGETVEIVMFPNKFKNAPNHPDWRIYLSNPRNGGQQSNAPQQQRSKPRQQQRNVPVPPRVNSPPPPQETSVDQQGDQPTL